MGCQSSKATSDPRYDLKGISEEEMKECKEAFDEFDLDGSGQISASEFANVMKALGVNMTKEEAKDVVKHLDIDGSGSIGFKEFLPIARDMKAKKPKKKNKDQKKKDKSNKPKKPPKDYSSDPKY